MGDVKEKFKVDFIGVGAPKCGTSWIYRCLNEHPGICMSEPKETYFFSSYQGEFRKDYPDNYHKGISEYVKYFSSCPTNSKIGEYCTVYLYDEIALKRIKKNFSGIKIIICLRNPIERSYSHYLHFLSKGLEKNIFLEALKVNNEYVERSKYSKYIQKCYEIFRRENVIVLTLDEIIINPKKVVEDLYKFLGVDRNYIPKVLHKKFNTSKIRSSKLYMISKKIKARYGKFFLGMIAVKIFYKINYIYNTLKPCSRFKYKISEKHRKELEKIFSEDILNLEKIINKDLSNWR